MYYNKMIKLYRVEFIEYNNHMYDSISCSKWNTTISLSEPKYLIIKESDIDYYRNFGGGIKSMDFIGYMEDRNVNEVED